ncbi:AAA family ATPase [Staphylothermus hellenicus]|uniref:SMC domain protein n=1 Tax=Staphylothermus hellenicus (strain DSM 12710 / JCM 10830 / BK20S6-10-b1 / P8) TaxID=591019 RepID=D7DCG2_STAHD|nr:SMC family ATPase [Staphylothermus hellenicus]ADI31859.1 SMC domain protein [Staphylothermus hellenicus DSM 12710]
MIILGLRLKNIRSYTDKTIVFPRKGITVIYGDVGTGKSTILSSIAYALFGQPRSRIPDPMERYAYPKGEDLLRIGKRNGYVRLLILQKNRIILVERGLSRRSDGKVSDTGGRLLVFKYTEENGELKIKPILNRYYSSEELKKRVLNELGIPEIISKQKPLIFTNTIYVPQFSVNDIINLGDKERTLLINKALNIDKYNHIKTNLDKLTRQILNSEIRNMKSQEQRIENILSKNDIEELKRKISEDEKEINNINMEIQQVEEAKKELENEIKKYQEQYEKKQEERNNIQQKLAVIKYNLKILREKEDKIKQLTSLLGINESIPPHVLLSKIKSELEEIDKQIKMVDQQKQELQKKIEEYSRRLDTINEEINKYREKIGGLKEKIKDKKDDLSKKQEELREKEELLRKGICPLCKQKIPHEHGIKLIDSLNNEIEMIEKEILELEQLLRKNHEELKGYEEKKSEINEEIEHLEQQLKSVDEEKDKLINEKMELNNKLSKLSEIERLHDEIEKLRQSIRDRDLLEKQLMQVEESINRLKEVIDEKTKNQKLLMEKEKELIGKREKMKAEIEYYKKQIQQFEDFLKEYQSVREQRIFLEKMKKFLYGERTRRGYFYDLVEKVEERVRSLAYDKFRALFIEYFLRLMEDHEILDVDLDEKFRPVFRIKTGRVTGEITQPSGGQLTSVSLAYRLALNTVARKMTPQLRNSTLILDEPTYGFSPERVEKLRELLYEISNRGKRQIIVVTHDRNLLEVGDCKIKLDINRENNETIVSYEECTALTKEYYTFIENLLSKRDESITTIREEERTEKGLSAGFEPKFRGKRTSKPRNIFDFLA